MAKVLKSRIFTLSELFRLGLWPTQPPNQWVPDFVPSGKVAREWSWPHTSI